MPEHPAEIPAEGEGGSGRIRLPRRPGGVGGPNELPPFVSISVSQLVNEVFRLRDRVHALESQALASRIGAGNAAAFGVGGPQELPEGEGGGGGVVPIHEIHEINELPASRFVTEFNNLVARVTQFEKNVLQQLGSIVQRLDVKK